MISLIKIFGLHRFIKDTSSAEFEYTMMVWDFQSQQRQQQQHQQQYHKASKIESQKQKQMTERI